MVPMPVRMLAGQHVKEPKAVGGTALSKSVFDPLRTYWKLIRGLSAYGQGCSRQAGLQDIY